MRCDDGFYRVLTEISNRLFLQLSGNIYLTVNQGINPILPPFPGLISLAPLPLTNMDQKYIKCISNVY